jgi:pimeloyl-ACP methyl ester carboxylesterase
MASHPPDADSSVFDRAETAPTQFLTADSVRFAYRSLGSGSPPLVLLQRFRGTLDDWDPALLHLLARERRVIIFDNTGVGSSSGVVPTSTRAMADAAASFVHALGIEQADILGWSMGGMVAQCLVLQHPALVRRLVLAGTAGPAIPGTLGFSAEVARVATKPVNPADDFLYLFFSLESEGRAAGAASLHRIAQRQPPTDLPVVQSAWMAQAAANNAFVNGREIEYEQLKRIHQPTLVANGDQDVMLPTVDSELLAQQIPGAELVIYPGSGHGFLFQYYEEFGRRVLDFLR